MDIITLALAKKYTKSVALHGVPIQHPRINPTTRTWEIFNPMTNSYVDTGIRAEAIIPHVGDNGNWWIADVDTGQFAGISNFSELISKDSDNAIQIGTDDKLFVPKASEAEHSFTHVQNTASASWIVPHNLNQLHVNVQVIDNAGNTVWASIEYTNANVLTLNFSQAIIGTAIIRR